MPITALETERLLLLPLTWEAAKALVPLANNENVSRWTARLPYPYTEADAKAWFESITDEDFAWTLMVRGDASPIGTIGFRCKAPDTGDLGYWLGEPYWRKGFVSEAARAVADYGFNHLGFTRVRAGCNPDNAATKRIFEKLKMTYVETIDEFLPARGRSEPTAYFEVERSTWR